MAAFWTCYGFFAAAIVDLMAAAIVDFTRPHGGLLVLLAPVAVASEYGSVDDLPMDASGHLAENVLLMSRQGVCATGAAERRAWLEAARNMHWFGHKPSNSQRYWVMEPACRAPRAVRNGRIVGGGGWKLPLRNCTVPYCLGRAPVEYAV